MSLFFEFSEFSEIINSRCCCRIDYTKCFVMYHDCMCDIGKYVCRRYGDHCECTEGEKCNATLHHCICVKYGQKKCKLHAYLLIKKK